MEKEMWDAYAKQAGGVTSDGKPLPTWDELGDERQACWKAAAATLLRVLKQLDNDIESAIMSDDEYCKTIENDNKRLREVLTWIERHPVEESKQWEVAVKEMKRLARSALQQKESK